SPGSERSPRRPTWPRGSAPRRSRHCAPAPARTAFARDQPGTLGFAWSCGRPREQRIEFTGFLQLVELIAPTDVGLADENLRHRPAAMRALNHFGPSRGVAHDIDFGEADAFARE